MVSDCLIRKISSKEAQVGVIGLGYVGLTLSIAANQVGFKVNGYDINEDRVSMLNRGESYVTDVGSKELKSAIKNKKSFSAYSSFENLADCDIFIICVQTNLNIHNAPDLRPIKASAESISLALRGNQLIILESTVHPGALEDVILPYLEKHGQKLGRDFLLSTSPERIDPGNKDFPMTKIPKLVGSVNEDSQRASVAFYKTFIEEIVPVKNDKIAQLSKLLENTYRAVNIALVNELMMTSEKLGVDIWEVIEAAKTKPFGLDVFTPGPGTGGSCIPIDPFYLVWKMEEINEHSEFIEVAGKINERVPRYVVERITAVLNERGFTVKDTGILVLGVTYKPDVADLSRTPAFPIMEQLIDEQAKVSYYDPFFNEINVNGSNLKSKKLTARLVRSMDMILILTNHSSIDYKLVEENAKLIFDSRNQYKESNERIYRL